MRSIGRGRIGVRRTNSAPHYSHEHRKVCLLSSGRLQYEPWFFIRREICVCVIVVLFKVNANCFDLVNLDPDSEFM